LGTIVPVIGPLSRPRWRLAMSSRPPLPKSRRGNHTPSSIARSSSSIMMIFAAGLRICQILSRTA
jgi:hypothetical protein